MSTTRPRSQAPDLTIVGSAGLVTVRGILHDAYQHDLSGVRGRKTLREMTDDAVISGILMAIRGLCVGTKWPINAANDTPEAIEVRDFVQSCFDDMSIGWNDTLSEILSKVVYGWSYLETVYKLRGGDTNDPSTRSAYNDGRIGWRKWLAISQDTFGGWLIDDDGGIQGLLQVAPPYYVPTVIPIEKALLFRTEVSQSNPDGRSLLRGAYRSWFFKRNIENIEAIGIERDIAGLPVIDAPAKLFAADASEPEKEMLASLTRLVATIRNDEAAGLVMPRAYDDAGHELYSFRLAASAGSKQIDTDKVIARYDQRTAMSMLADFILLGHEAVGSKALSVDKTALFAAALDAINDHIAGVINDHALPRLLRVNGIDLALRPRVEPSRIRAMDLGVLGTFLQALSSAGAALFPDPGLEDYLLGLADLPAPARPDQQPPASVAPDETSGADDETGPQDRIFPVDVAPDVALEVTAP